MKLVGMLDSPFVRRVAITMRMLGIPYEHVNQSVVAGYADFQKINPLAKAPTLIFDDGEMLIDSTLIIDHMESLAGRSLMPADVADRRRALQLIGVALLAGEKGAQRMYELTMRPQEKQHEPWLTRLEQQLAHALDWLESAVAGVDDDRWFFGAAPTQADMTVAIVWRFINRIAASEARPESRPALCAFGDRAEALPEFLACPLD